MSTNSLLVKDQLGRPRQSVRNLPKAEHSYGKPNYPDAVGAAGCKYLLRSITLILPSDIIMANPQNSNEESHFWQWLHEVE